MKKIGIIGGVGPESTLDYYRQIIDAFKNEKGDPVYPEIIIYSVNIYELIALMKQKRLDDVTSLLTDRIGALKRAGAEFAAISANTPHIVFDSVKERSPLPLISIVEATCSEAVRRGVRRPGLFGTAFTMNASFYPEVFRKHGMEVIMPDEEDKQLINDKLFSEIELGIFKDETRDLLVRIIEKMAGKQHIDSIILGCTEFPLILTESAYAGIPVLDTTRIHVQEIIRRCKAEG